MSLSEQGVPGGGTLPVALSSHSGTQQEGEQQKSNVLLVAWPQTEEQITTVLYLAVWKLPLALL